MKKPTSNRRNFIKKAVGTSLLAGAAPSLLMAGKSKQTFLIKEPENELKKYAANDKVNIAVIGMGIMGFNNLSTSVQIPGVKLVAACDLYTGRLDRTKELYGKDIFTTKDYKEILDRKDIDAVIIATSDHWHDRISIDAMNKGKHVYCEKPMVHRLDEGQAVIDTQAKTKKVFQVGSQSASNLVSHKAKEIYESGAIGQLIMVETYNDRQGGSGAWQYSIPTDAGPATVDWDRYLGDAPKIPFDAKRFFRWRNYQDYGTGIAGDLFVHLFTNFHTITGSTGPDR
ncbi:MAG: Gfo/Idh/MocA family oxidoreductase, partial [Imperialibacter sp.]